MFSTDSYIEKYDTTCQAQLGDERVLAAVQCGRAGGAATLILSQVSGLAGILSMVGQKQKAAGLPQLFFLAVTEDRLVVLKARNGTSWKAGKVLMAFDRADVRVTTGKAPAGTKIVIDVADGTHIEAQGPMGRLSDRVVALLAQPQAVAA